MSPSQAIDKSEISPRSKYLVAWFYAYSKCEIQQRNIKMSSDELMKKVKSQLKKGNRANPNLIKDSLVIQVGEKIAKIMGNDCSKSPNIEFEEAQYELFREDIYSVEKYEKLSGKKFTPKQKSLYQSLKRRANTL